MAIFATAADLTDYLGKAAPSDAVRLLARAQEIIEAATMTVVVTTDTADLTALKLATCAQVEFWLETGEEHGILGQQGQIQIERTIYTAPDKLSPRAATILKRRLLMYRGVNMA